jgi:heterotetrameric sarcosine oxidase delta subunit
MLLIPCPWCGPRDESEFSYGGEANIVRPKDPAALSDEEWGEYLYMRNNTRGPHCEQWCHAAGCRRWFNMRRNTLTNEIKGVYRVGESMRGGNADAE